MPGWQARQDSQEATLCGKVLGKNSLVRKSRRYRTFGKALGHKSANLSFTTASTTGRILPLPMSELRRHCEEQSTISLPPHTP